VDHTVDLGAERATVGRREPQAGGRQLGADRAQPGGRGGRVVVELAEQLCHAVVRLAGIGGAHPEEDVRTVLLLEQMSDQLHPEEARASGEEDRVAHASGAPMAW